MGGTHADPTASLLFKDVGLTPPPSLCLPPSALFFVLPDPHHLRRVSSFCTPVCRTHEIARRGDRVLRDVSSVSPSRALFCLLIVCLRPAARMLFLPVCATVVRFLPRPLAPSRRPRHTSFLAFTFLPRSSRSARQLKCRLTTTSSVSVPRAPSCSVGLVCLSRRLGLEVITMN